MLLSRKCNCNKVKKRIKIQILAHTKEYEIKYTDNSIGKYLIISLPL